VTVRSDHANGAGWRNTRTTDSKRQLVPRLVLCPWPFSWLAIDRRVCQEARRLWISSIAVSDADRIFRPWVRSFIGRRGSKTPIRYQASMRSGDLRLPNQGLRTLKASRSIGVPPATLFNVFAAKCHRPVTPNVQTRLCRLCMCRHGHRTQFPVHRSIKRVA
jgi:hypothetical protein